MRTVAVTGANGKTGRGVVDDLLNHGYSVRPIDVTGTPGDRGHFGTLGLSLLHADLTDFGDTVDALSGVDGVVHLAAIPAPGFVTDARTLHANTAMSGNVFLAAARLGLERVVWASSETTLGLPFAPHTPPRYLPVDEDHYPYPTSTYALSKVVGETQARHVSAWSGIPIVALRLSNVHVAADYSKILSYWSDPLSRVWNVWGYVDVRDVAQACRKALHADVTGAPSYVVAAADTLMDRPSADLAREILPDVPVLTPLDGCATLLSNARAEAELGYTPEHSWREMLDTPS